jgi:hypothetical protein
MKTWQKADENHLASARFLIFMTNKVKFMIINGSKNIV